MSRQGFSIEKLLEITSENSDTGVQILFGSGAPGGDTGEQDDAPIGSLYLDTANGHTYKKDADANVAADWFQYDTAFTQLGTDERDADMGTYTGSIVVDNGSVKDNIQDLETYIETNIVEDDSADGVTAEATVDEELVDNILAVTYFVVVSMFDDESRRRSFYVTASHNGTPSADATEVDDTLYAKNRHGAAFNYTLSFDLNGAGAAQEMRLRLASTETNGVNVRSRKVGQVNA